MEHNDNEQHPFIEGNNSSEQAHNVQTVRAPATLVSSVLSRINQANTSFQSIRPDTIDQLLKASHDPDWYIRATAIRQLGELGEQIPIERLIAALSDEDETVRATAVQALGKSGSQAPVDLLIAALQDPAWSVREVAALTLGKMHARPALEALQSISTAESEDVEVREAAKLALQQMHAGVLSPLPTPASTTLQAENGTRPHEAARFSRSKITDLIKSRSRQNIIHKDIQEEDIIMLLPNIDAANSQSKQPASAKTGLRRIARIGEGVVAALLIVGILLSWLIIAQREHTLSSVSSHSIHPTHSKPSFSSLSPFTLGMTGHDINLTVANGVVYAGSGDNAVYALRGSDGTLLWRYNTAGTVGQPPLVVNGIVYASTYVNQGQGIVYALRTSNGKLLWRFNGKGYLNLTVVHGVAYIGSQGGTVSALRADDGSLLWQITTAGGVDNPLVVVNNAIYFSTYVDNQTGTAYIYALRASNGTVLWRFTTSSDGLQPTIANGVVYTNTRNGITALRESDGTPLWNFDLNNTGFQDPIVRNGIVYTSAIKVSLALNSTNNSGGYVARTRFSTRTMPFKSGVSTLYALRASDGTPLWHYTLNGGKNSWGTLFGIVNGVAYIGTNVDTGKNSIYALRASDGSLLWHYLTNDTPTSATIGSNVLQVGSLSGSVFALKVSDGSLLWHSPIIGEVFNTPIVAGNRVYASALNGIIYTLQADTGSLLWYYQTVPGI